MADNVTCDPGSGGDTLAADDIGGVKYPRSKITIGADGTNDGDVSSANPLPVGDAGGSLTVDNAHLTSLGGAISGTEVQVDVVAALPAGTNAIGKLAANSGVDVGDVDVTSVVPGTGASSLGKAEDAVHASGDVGVMALAVRKDTASALAGTDGDYIPLIVDSSGKLHVNIGSNASVNVSQVGGATVLTGGGVESGALRVTVASDSTGVLSVDDNGASLTVDNADLTTLAGAVAGTEMQVDVVGALPAGTNNIGDVDVLSVVPGTGATNLGKAVDSASGATDTGMAPLAVRDDALSALTPVEGDYVPLRVDANGALWVGVSGTVTVGAHAVTNAGTFAVQVDGAALTALQLIDDPVFADDAAFTPGTSKLNAVGFLADETNPDSVDEGDVGVARMTLDRKQHVVAELESSSMRAAGAALTPKFAVIDAASSGDNTLVAAVSGKKIRVLAAYLVAAGTVAVRFEDGAGGSAKSGQMNLVANTGFVLPFSPVGWFEGTATTLLNLELSAAVSVDGSLVYAEV